MDSTEHGLQFLDPVRAAWPTAYYSERSGVGLAMSALPAGSRRIGVGRPGRRHAGRLWSARGLPALL